MSKFAIQITLIGDLGTHKGQWQTFYIKRRQTSLSECEFSQEFTCINLEQPTTFARETFAEQRAEQIRKVCNRLSNNLTKDDINRRFVVRVVPYKA